jgi:rubrerythrin
MLDQTSDPHAGPSIWQRGPDARPLLQSHGPMNFPPPDLYAHLTSHVEAERGLLEEYKAAAEHSPSKALRYLINLLMEDEIRHHRIFTELAESVRAREIQNVEGHWSDGNPVVPHSDFDQLDRTNQAAVIDITEQLLQKEHEDARELKRLQRELRDVKDTTLWSLLVELMQRDTQKHIAILRFAKKHAGRRIG